MRKLGYYTILYSIVTDEVSIGNQLPQIFLARLIHAPPPEPETLNCGAYDLEKSVGAFLILRYSQKETVLVCGFWEIL